MTGIYIYNINVLVPHVLVINVMRYKEVCPYSPKVQLPSKKKKKHTEEENKKHSSSRSHKNSDGEIDLVMNTLDQYINRQQQTPNTTSTLDPSKTTLTKSRSAAIKETLTTTVQLQQQRPPPPKIRKVIEFMSIPAEINLTGKPYFSPDDHTSASTIAANYSLYGAIIHQGESMQAGHYYALIKVSDDLDATQLWYKFDDKKVTLLLPKCPPNDVESPLHTESVLLFYKQTY
jgi:hypothetical protein